MKTPKKTVKNYFQLFPIPTQKVYYTERVMSSVFFAPSNSYKLRVERMVR